MSFDWQMWTERFKQNPGYNDSGLVVSNRENPLYKVLGVHLLLPDEYDNQPKILVDVLCKPSQPGGPKRVKNAVIHWTWEGRIEPGLPGPVYVDKPLNEIALLPIADGMKINLWHPMGEGVIGLHGNKSFLVVFQQVDDSQPEPEPELPKLVGGIQIVVNQAWIASLRPDSAGNVTFQVDIKD